MTDQITVPRATWDAMLEALEESNSLLAASMHEKRSNDEIEKQVFDNRVAITAANAVSEPKVKLIPTAEELGTPVQPQAQGASSEQQYAKHLCIEMARKHYPEAAQFKPQDDLLGILTQIDNMVAGLVRPQATEPAWRPIESAPKDAKILLWGKYWNNADVFQHPMIGMWNPISERWEVNFNAWFGVQPTHWMPLPAAPEAP